MTEIAQRALGKTGLQVSAISLGTVGLGLQYGIAADSGNLPPAHDDAVQLVRRAIAAGVTFIDTARGYGTSESVVGAAIAGQRDRVQVVTKVSALQRDGQPLRGIALQQRIAGSIAESLRQLKTDYVDVLMLHSASLELLRDDTALLLLRSLQSSGMTRRIGASTYGAEASLLALEQGAEVLQVAYNVLDQRMADTVFPRAQALGAGIVVRSVYLKGALTARGDHLPDHLAALRDLSRRFRAQAAEIGLSPVEAALRFALSHPAIDSVLFGIQSASELDTALNAAAQGALAPDAFDLLAALRSDDPALVDPSRWGIP